MSDVFISFTMTGTINWGLEVVNFCHIFFFSCLEKSPWTGLGPQDFCGIFGHVGFLIGWFFGYVGFFGPSPHGIGPSPVSWTKLTTLVDTPT